MLKEARRLYDMGLAVHWLRERSKIPVKPNWTAPTRDTWPEIKQTSLKGYNLGVRLGKPSKLKGGYLAAIDIDIKGEDPKYLKEALAWLEKKVPGITDTAPFDLSGRGNGSRHYFIKVHHVLPSGKLTASHEQVKVKMPSVKATPKQIEVLGKDAVSKGWRLRPAWEIDFMCKGRQVAIPPSIHPDTAKPYIWGKPIHDGDSIPLIAAEKLVKLNTEKGRPVGAVTLKDFNAVPVDLIGSRLSSKMVDMILSGDGVEDRSAACFSVSLAMSRLKFTDDEIMSVLTDQSTFLGETAYDHANTNSRARAARWVRDYCLERAKRETSAIKAFEEDVEELPALNEKAAADQEAELLEPNDWQDRLQRTGIGGSGPPKVTLKNVVMILVNMSAENVFKRDTFAQREFYGCDAPWGGVKGRAPTDTDLVMIKHWVGQHFQFEPNVNLVAEAINYIAQCNAFHPVKEHLEALPEWDGVNRLDGWLKKNFNAHGPEHYLGDVFRKFLVAAVTRIYRPGTKFDWMLILEGVQGIGKSTFARMLAGDKYFTDWLPDLSDKDAAQALQGIWFIEMGELAQLKKTEIETIKGFITRTTDKYRPSYGRMTIEAHRQCVFMGSTNAEEYLRDDTGNRRFIPIKVGRLNFKALEQERDQLFAEALFIFKNSLEDRLDLEGESDNYAKKIQAARMVKDESFLMKEVLLDFIETEKKKPPKERFNFERFQMMDLFGERGGMVLHAPLKNWRFDARNAKFAARALKLIGAINWKSHGTKCWKLIKGDRNSPRFDRTVPTKK